MRIDSTPADGVRSFVAVDLSTEVRRLLVETIRSLAGSLPKETVRWVRPEGTHLTLKFLGEVAANRVPEIESSLQSAVEGQPPFEVVVEGLGCFPSASRPRVVWIGIQDPTGWLVRTQHEIEAALAGIGFPREDRPFSPHLTLGRLRDGMPPAVARGVGEALGRERPGQPCGMPVREIKLYRSELRPGGAVYSALWVGKLESGR